VYTFEQITNNGNTNVGGQIELEVNDLGSSMIEFLVSNVGPVSSIVTQIAFDDDDLLLDGSSLVIFNGPGVIMVNNGNTNIPAANNATPPFVATYGVARQNQGGVNNGINVGEFVSLTYTLTGSNTYADLIAALDGGTYRAGLHVQGIAPQGGSEAYVNIPRSVPEPSTIALAGLGMLGLGLGALRKLRGLI
jgi:hypothetical protein